MLFQQMMMFILQKIIKMMHAHPLTREQYRKLINMGFTDLVKHFVEGKTNWTFWGYRGGGWQKGNGLRIDHFLTTANITDLIKKVEVNREPRGWEKLQITPQLQLH